MQFASLTESSWRNKMWKLWIFSVLFAPVVFAKPEVCLLPSLKGPCRARFQRYFFNSQTGTCETFIYGGCRGNANNFRSEQECQETCTSELDCYLPPVRGLCKAYMPSYFWNSTSNTCEKFIYGGCGGNANRFSSVNDCQAKCDPVCELPPVQGLCKAYMPSYFWNSTSNTCEKFIYGGCGGNANRFSSVNDCEARCNPVCDLPPVQGYCRAYIPSFFWNSTSNACEQFIYGGCGGNDNRFSSVIDCIAKCDKVCNLPPVTGLCEAYIPSYFWNSTSNTCEQFIYGGCGGNANRFSSVKDCAARCNPVCDLPPLTGSCKASFQRYFWNSTSNACETFIYGGCKGNSNRFSSKEDCETMCDSVCDIPIAPGTCGSNIASYGWNKETGKCQYFTYGGCGGNDNRFTTKHDCLEMCGPPRVCKLSVDSGDCEGEFIKYYFNPTSGYCEKFTYGGCNGNQNNFDTEQQCMDHCKPTHSVCSLDYDRGRCFGQIPSFYYNPKAKECQRFFYGGCGGNGNRFESYDSCMDKCSPLRKSVYDNL